VIGNPPYVTYKGKQKVNISQEQLNTLINSYPNSAEYKVNSYALFVEAGLNISKKNALLSFIIPSTILQNEYLKKIRRYLLCENSIKLLVSFENKVFEAVTDSIIINVSKGVTIGNMMRFSRVNSLNLDSINYKHFSTSEWINHDNGHIIDTRTSKNDALVFEKMERNSIALGSLYKVYVGIVANGIKKFLSDYPVDSNYKPYLQGKHIGHYETKFNSLYINFIKEKLHSNTDEQVYELPEKILVRKTGNVLIATIDRDQFYTDQSIYNLYLKPNKSYSNNVLVAILNSTLLNYYYNKKLITNADVFPYIKGIHIKSFPIPLTIEKVLLDKINERVSYIINTKKSDPLADVYGEEREIDRLVYQLYGLTEEEIAIVEGTK
jgi:hypothetical protein